MKVAGIITIISLILITGWAGCSSPRRYPDPAPVATPETAPGPDLTPVSEPAPIPETNINIALDYFGITDTLEGVSPAKVQLLAMVMDQKQELVRMVIPPEGIPGYDMTALQIRDIKKNMDPVIYRGSVVGNVSIYFAAYNISKGPSLREDLELAGKFFGIPNVDVLKSAIPDKEPIGHYWRTWNESSNWGIGTHSDVGEGDFRVWLRVWSDKIIEPVEPPFSLPLETYEFEVGYSAWPASRGASQTFERPLNAGDEINGRIEWPAQMMYDWSLYIYAPDGSTVLDWSGTDSSHSFRLVAIGSGTYTIEILKRDYLKRKGMLTIEPPDWKMIK